MILSRAQELSPSLSASTATAAADLNPFPLSLNPNTVLAFPVMRASSFSCFSLLRSSLSLSLCRHGGSRRFLLGLSFQPVPEKKTQYPYLPSLLVPPRSSTATLVAQRSGSFVERVETEQEEKESWDFTKYGDESEVFDFGEVGPARDDVRHLPAARMETEVEVRALEDMPEQWRRSKLAWLCKELPLHKAGTLVRILNAQRKWVRQEDATYVAVHCMRIRENETGFRVYKWMMQQHWYRFDFGLATKLADYLGKEQKFAKCREIFDDILNQGRVPSESTFHILVVAYLSAAVRGCLEESCNIYNRMIQLGGYQPRLSLHNSLFRALISKPGGYSKHHLKQAEFIFHNLVTTGLEVQKDIYGGLIWLHSYQDTIDKDRIASLREEMRKAGFQESKEVLVSILRACAKEGDVEEAERTWLKLLESDDGIPSQAFVYKMEVYSNVGDFARSLEIFREMEKHLGSASVAGYHKIIEILCKAEKVEIADSLMKEFIESKKKPLMPSYIDIVGMYLDLGLHDKLELTFLECMEKCRLNQTIYNIYLDSLVKVGNLDKAEKIFDQMHINGTISVNARSCNTILRGHIDSGNYVKAEKIYDFMCQKKYDIEPLLMEKLDYVLSLQRKEVKKPLSLKLSKEQREILVGLLLGGLRVESDVERKNHMVRFEFRDNSETHSILRQHIHDQYHEWLHPSSKSNNNVTDDIIPFKFSTISHSYFGFYADQFWPKGRAEIPKLIHRWLSPRALAYWYMYGGHRTSSGDILLRLKGSLDGVEKVVKALKGKSIGCRVKKKGTIFWVGVLGSNSTWFWKLIEPYVLDGMRDFINPGGENMSNNGGETQTIDFDSRSDNSDDASY